MITNNADISLILFDLGNVLVKFDHSIVARKLAKLSKTTMSGIVTQFISSGLGSLLDEGKIDAREFSERVISALNLPMGVDEFQKHWNEIFFENPGMESLLKRLKEKYPVYLISDTNPLHFEFIRKKFSILNHIDQFFLSYEIGVKKPDPRIYFEVLKRSRAKAESVLYIDDREDLVAAARKMGFSALVFKSPKSLEKELIRRQVLDKKSGE